MKNKGINFRRATFFGVLCALVLIFLLWLIFKDNLITYSPIIFLASVVLTLIMMGIFSRFSRRISWSIEPGDNEKILELEMNESLAYSIALFGFGLAFILAAIIPNFSFDNIKELSLMIGMLFVFVGQVILTTEYKPRFRKLKILYSDDIRNLK